MKYRFKDEEERTPVYHIINTTFPVLLEILNHLLALPNPSIEVADLIKLILKIFWSSAYVSDGNLKPYSVLTLYVLLVFMKGSPVPCSVQSRLSSWIPDL